MAERWQQWMPFHIDKFRGSPVVQAMHPAARLGYIYLLASAWQSSDCTVSGDAMDLATESGLGDDLWAVHGPRILRKFICVEGRLHNSVLQREWDEAKSKFEHNRQARREAGKIGNEKRWGRKRDEETSQTDRNDIANGSQNIATLTGTDTSTGTRILSTKNKQKPSRDKRESDPRHTPCKWACETYAKFKGVTFLWGPAEAKQLSELLSAAPDLTVEEFQQCLQNRARSPGTVHSERPRKYLPNILSYQQGPLNQFNRPEGTDDGRQSKTSKTLDAGRTYLEKEMHKLGLSEDGYPSSSFRLE